MTKSKALPSAKVDEPDAAYRRILRWFFDYSDREISLTDLCTNTSTSKRVGNRVVSQLERIGFLNRSVFGRAWVLKANQQHPYFQQNKLPQTLMLLLPLYWTTFRELILHRAPGGKAVILFGSYRRGDDNAASDIDLAVEVPGNKEIQIVDLFKLPRLGYRENIWVRLHIFSRNKIDLNVFNSIANGIILEGFLEVRP